MKQDDLFPPSAVDQLIDRMADAALAEIKAMAEHARRSIGQRTRLDHFRRRLARKRIARMTLPELQREANLRASRLLDLLAARRVRHVVGAGNLVHVVQPEQP